MAEFERDLSRAHWQRSEAMVLFTELTDSLLADSVQLIHDESILHERENSLHYGHPWFGAHQVAGVVEKVSKRLLGGAAPETYVLPHSLEGTEQRVKDYCYEATVRNVMLEAMTTMTTFPVNLAYSLDHRARKNGADFRIDNLSDAASTFRSGWFQTMCNQAALTKNTMWSTYSVNRYPGSGVKEPEWLGFNFDGVFPKLSDYTVWALKDGLKRVNKDSIPDKLFTSSSGCPVRHTRPRFMDNQEDHAQLTLLSDYFEKSSEELTAESPQSVITSGLDYMADLFDEAYKINQ